MRETLHQLCVTLALPLAVAAVWGARGDPAGAPAAARATAYRADLDPLPLPTPERLRAPREAVPELDLRVREDDWSGPRRRAALGDAPARKSVALESPSAPASGRDAAPSPRDWQEPPVAAPAAGIPSMRAGAPLVAVGPGLATSGSVELARPESAVEADGAIAPAKDEVVHPSVERVPLAALEPDAKVVVGAVSSPRDAVPTAAAAPASAVQVASLRPTLPAAPVRPQTASPSTPTQTKGLDRSLPTPIRAVAPAHDAGTLTDPPRAEPAKAASPSVEDRGAPDRGWSESLVAAAGFHPLASTQPSASEPIGLSLRPDAAGSPVSIANLAPSHAEDFSDMVLEALAPQLPAPAQAALAAQLSAPSSSSSRQLFTPSTVIFAIPEPASALLLGAALAALGAARRRASVRATARRG